MDAILSQYHLQVVEYATNAQIAMLNFEWVMNMTHALDALSSTCET